MKRKHEYEAEIQALKNRLIGDDCAVMRLERRVAELEEAIKEAEYLLNEEHDIAGCHRVLKGKSEELPND